MQYPDYDPALDPPALDADELEALDALLRGLPADDVMNVEALDGYLSGLLLGPRLVSRLPTAHWLPPVWGGDGAGTLPFASQKQRKRLVVLVLRHLRSIDRAFAGAPQDWEPVFSVAETTEAELVDAEDWCIGFLQAVALDAAAWEAHWDAALLAAVERLGGEDAAAIEDDAERDRLSRAAADAVAQLAQRGPQAGT